MRCFRAILRLLVSDVVIVLLHFVTTSTTTMMESPAHIGAIAPSTEPLPTRAIMRLGCSFYKIGDNVPLQPVGAETSPSSSLALSPDGKHIAMAGGGAIRLID